MLAKHNTRGKANKRMNRQINNVDTINQYYLSLSLLVQYLHCIVCLKDTQNSWSLLLILCLVFENFRTLAVLTFAVEMNFLSSWDVSIITGSKMCSWSKFCDGTDRRVKWVWIKIWDWLDTQKVVKSPFYNLNQLGKPKILSTQRWSKDGTLAVMLCLVARINLAIRLLSW